MLLLTTPKVGGRRRGFLGGLLAVWRESGADYLLSMALMQAAFEVRRRLERLATAPARRMAARVGDEARRLGFQHAAVRDVNGPAAREAAAAFAPHVGVAVYFNQIVREPLLSAPPLGFYNLHPSFLPEFRGVSPHVHALAAGAPRAGFSIHRLTPEVDGGDLFARRETPIRPDDSAFSLYRRVTRIGAGLVRELLDRAAEARAGGGAPAIPMAGPQEANGSYFGAISRATVQQLRARGHTLCGGVFTA